MTLTQTTFALCGFVFGPAYGVWATRFIHGSDTGFKKVMAFLMGMSAAYAGWGLSGLSGMYLYPQYPYQSPGELMGNLFTVPGFITGTAAAWCIFKKQK